MHGNSHFIQQPHYNNNMSYFNANPCNYVDSYQPPWAMNSSSGPNVHTNMQTTISIALNQRKEDAEFFENFINKHTNSSVVEEKTTIKPKRLGISQTRFLLTSIKKHNMRLRELTSVLENGENNLSESEWQDKIDECNAEKSEIVRLLTTLQEAEKICKLDKLIEKRKKKRQREKRKREAWKAMKISNAEKRSRLHATADRWVREEQAVIEREKQEENLRKDADLVLFDVRAKRNDSKKFLALLKELQTLRAVKVTNARARGEKLSAAADESFEKIIGQLTEFWSKLNREYSIEEQGLKLMLKTDNEKTIEKKKKSSFDDWEYAIFGRKLPSIDSMRKDLNSLLLTRFSWDKYISHDGEGSRVPIGWVMPESSSSAAWQKLLKR